MELEINRSESRTIFGGTRYNLQLKLNLSKIEVAAANDKLSTGRTLMDITLFDKDSLKPLPGKVDLYVAQRALKAYQLHKGVTLAFEHLEHRGLVEESLRKGYVEWRDLLAKIVETLETNERVRQLRAARDQQSLGGSADRLT